MKNNYIVKNQDVGMRVDAYLSEVSDQTRSQIKKDIIEERIQVNGKNIKPSYKLEAEDSISWEQRTPYEIVPNGLPLEIVYSDKDLFVIIKPAGLVVHPGAGEEKDSVVHRLLSLDKNLPINDDPLRPGIVHRLDKDTSGLMVVARNEDSYVALVEQFKKHEVYKEYCAIVHNTVKNKGVLTKAIGRNPNNRIQMAVDVFPSKEAITHYEPLLDLNGFTLIKVIIETGRTHQIRVHMNSIGYPVVGDTLYGPKNAKAKRQLLHSKKIEISHPITNKKLLFETNLPEDFFAFIKSRGVTYASNI